MAYVKFPSGPRPTYEVNAVLPKHKLVTEDGTTGKIKVAGAGDIVLGFSLVNAKPDAADTSTDDFGDNVLYAGPKTKYTSVETAGVIVIKNGGAGAVTLGDFVTAAASGEVKAAATGDKPLGYVVKGGAAGADVEVQLSLGSQSVAVA